jgi:RNA polymerase sigma factor (sigma-70 family)
MRSPESTGRMVAQVKDGDPAGAEALWNHYFDQLMRLAHHKLQRAPRLSQAAEDFALSVLASFMRRAGAGRCPAVQTADDLRCWLYRRLRDKIVDRVRRECRVKRDSRRLTVETDLARPDSSEEAALAHIRGREPDPAEVTAFADQWEHLLGQLPDVRMRQVAQHEMEGLSQKEIADRLDVDVRTVKRKLQAIRKLWENELKGPGES